MAQPLLTSVRMLKNHGALVFYRAAGRRRCRFLRPDETVSTHEAAKLLGTNPNRLTRAHARGVLQLERIGLRWRVPLIECRRLLRLPPEQRFPVAPPLKAGVRP